MLASFTALTSLAVLSAKLANAQLDPAVTKPLADKHFTYPDQIPFMVDTDQGTRRGPQLGYNMCNSTTEGANSLCQTSFVNSADDFCLWAPSKANSAIADTEGEEVAWCTKPGRGTRVIPAGALTGVQFMRTPAYVQVVGFIDQTKINIADGDSGGELDPHGADLRGNPLGGLMYSNSFGGNNNTFEQVIEWHNFMGGNQFCIKVCDPSNPHAADFCQHIYDRIGCGYNAPNNAQDNTFESCEGDVQDYPGVYTQNGQTMTYTQPPESLGPIETMPYQPRVPASSNCVQFQSAALYAGSAPTATGPPAPAAPTSTGTKSGSASTSSTVKPSTSVPTALPSSSKPASKTTAGVDAASPTGTSGAVANGVRSGAVVAAVALGAMALF